MAINHLGGFEYAIERTLADEGGYVNDPSDSGGETKFGISKASYPGVDIRNLTRDGAKAIYERDYWNAYALGALESKYVAAEIFDTAVNCGPGNAVKIAQRAATLCGERCEVDGRIGPKTRGALNRLSGHTEYHESLLLAMNGYQFAYYESLIESDPRRLRFAKGWMKRLKLPVAMAGVGGGL